MGTVLHGVVECFIEKSDWSAAHWESFAEIEFNKDYRLQSALNNLDSEDNRNWLYPSYMLHLRIEESITIEQVRKAHIAHNAGWLSLNELEEIAAKLAAHEDGDSRSGQLIATIAFMREMQRRAFPKVRLLFYHTLRQS